MDGKYQVVDLATSPLVEQILLASKTRLSKRAVICDGISTGSKKWYEYQQINKGLNFDDEYIVYPNVSFGNNFTLSKGSVVDMTGFVINSNNRFILAILNSKLTK